MSDRASDLFAMLERYWSLTVAAIDGTAMMVALILFSAILAAAGGMVSWKMRLYGAIFGGMLVNAVVKAMGGGFEAALAAMMGTAVLGFLLGTTPLLLRLLTQGKLRSRPR